MQKDEQVDMALLLFNTMLHLHSNHDAQDCFSCICKALKPGGLLVVELPPVRDIFDGSFVNGEYWESPIKGREGIELITEYGTDDDEFDAESQVHFDILDQLQLSREISIVGQVSYLAWSECYLKMYCMAMERKAQA